MFTLTWPWRLLFCFAGSVIGAFIGGLIKPNNNIQELIGILFLGTIVNFSIFSFIKICIIDKKR